MDIAENLLQGKNPIMMVESKRCTKCGKLKPLSEFYRKGGRNKNGFEAQCRACKLAYQKERHKQVMENPNLHHKRLLTQSKYRQRYGDKIAQKQRLERRKMGISPQRYVNTKLLLELYAQGFSLDDIAERCNCAPSTVKHYAYKYGVNRGNKKKRICKNCENYPCFMGIETMSSNIAATCKSYKPNKKDNKDEQQREQNK